MLTSYECCQSGLCHISASECSVHPQAQHSSPKHLSPLEPQQMTPSVPSCPSSSLENWIESLDSRDSNNYPLYFATIPASHQQNFSNVLEFMIATNKIRHMHRQTKLQQITHTKETEFNYRVLFKHFTWITKISKSRRRGSQSSWPRSQSTSPSFLVIWQKPRRLLVSM